MPTESFEATLYENRTYQADDVLHYRDSTESSPFALRIIIS